MPTARRENCQSKATVLKKRIRLPCGVGRAQHEHGGKPDHHGKQLDLANIMLRPPALPLAGVPRSRIRNSIFGPSHSDCQFPKTRVQEVERRRRGPNAQSIVDQQGNSARRATQRIDPFTPALLSHSISGDQEIKLLLDSQRPKCNRGLSSAVVSKYPLSDHSKILFEKNTAATMCWPSAENSGAEADQPSQFPKCKSTPRREQEICAARSLRRTPIYSGARLGYLGANGRR